ncbi:hypothetical protein BDF20DRAFT_840496 [Mycotypha africana]|uniref:uncharacterized protein n=1 Tax=Mycotypha africana TaxID=64632 RepID=UPI0023014BF1|nr:uncharacterized protein BDF20DRAFT_840496 [Mycotypha africana]KAI8967102.1 hypothetical protein BDF20DRAFT_840496 [Mycotypha africana]
MSSLNNLPAEIYLNIVNHLSLGSLIACSKVCKATRSAALRVLYNRYTLSNRQLKKLSSFYEKENEIQTNNEIQQHSATVTSTEAALFPMHYVRKLIISFFGKTDRNEAIFRKIIVGFTHLHLIKIDHCELWHLEQLLHLAQSSFLCSLREINFSNFYSAQDQSHWDSLYLLLNQALSKTITHLQLDHNQILHLVVQHLLESNNNSSSTNSTDTNVTRRVNDYLKEFVRLNSLKIDNARSRRAALLANHGESIINAVLKLDIFTFLSHCPSLRKLHYISYEDKLVNDEQNDMRAAINHQPPGTPATNTASYITHSMLKNVYHHQLNELHLELGWLTEACTQTIATHLPHLSILKCILNVCQDNNKYLQTAKALRAPMFVQKLYSCKQFKVGLTNIPSLTEDEERRGGREWNPVRNAEGLATREQNPGNDILYALLFYEASPRSSRSVSATSTAPSFLQHQSQSSTMSISSAFNLNCNISPTVTSNHHQSKDSKAIKFKIEADFMMPYSQSSRSHKIDSIDISHSSANQDNGANSWTKVSLFVTDYGRRRFHDGFIRTIFRDDSDDEGEVEGDGENEINNGRPGGRTRFRLRDIVDKMTCLKFATSIKVLDRSMDVSPVSLDDIFVTSKLLTVHSPCLDSFSYRNGYGNSMEIKINFPNKSNTIRTDKTTQERKEEKEGANTATEQQQQQQQQPCQQNARLLEFENIILKDDHCPYFLPNFFDHVEDYSDNILQHVTAPLMPCVPFVKNVTITGFHLNDNEEKKTTINMTNMQYLHTLNISIRKEVLRSVSSFYLVVKMKSEKRNLAIIKYGCRLKVRRGQNDFKRVKTFKEGAKSIEVITILCNRIDRLSISINHFSTSAIGTLTPWADASIE